MHLIVWAKKNRQLDIPDQQNQIGTSHFPQCHLKMVMTNMSQKPLHSPVGHKI